MSEAVNRDYRLTIRLSDDEKNVLDALSERFNLDKSATVRKLLSQASPILAERGHFMPLNGRNPIALHLKRNADE